MKVKSFSFITFLFVFCSAFTIGVTVSTLIATVGLGQAAVPAVQLGYDAILAVFIAFVQMIWIGSETDTFAQRMRRSIIHLAALLGGCTVLMSLFGWLPPLGWPLFIYLAGFIGLYIVIWIVLWKYQQKKAAELNEQLDEYKKGVK